MNILLRRINRINPTNIFISSIRIQHLLRPYDSLWCYKAVMALITARSLQCFELFWYMSKHVAYSLKFHVLYPLILLRWGVWFLSVIVFWMSTVCNIILSLSSAFSCLLLFFFIAVFTLLYCATSSIQSLILSMKLYQLQLLYICNHTSYNC